MQSIFDTRVPRPEVLQGELTDGMFAARLRDVIEGTTEEVYGVPAKFFANTFPTDGLRTLLAEALGQLTGAKPNSNPVLRLETAFGGGKTHNLIALYHVAKGSVQPGVLTDMATPLPVRQNTCGSSWTRPGASQPGRRW